ncbi:MAG TPA: septum formation protein Maf [Candidatus Limousia pullorum]|uniref:dTTP/UTP pyrophosphatase n=1 Tax=Candidatus Limousia pullorum TaxID=2840860 RepID=A0A9D1LZC9_9FIRM|nr:septum formation protein Maf [Candidatus Limousia pullorum]
MSLFRLKDGENIILASASPRRRELFKLICEDFKSVSPDVDETVPAQVEILERPQFLAVKKAMHIWGCLSEKAVVIGCDTGVFIDDEMLGKPKDEEEAFSMLKKLQGKDHLVVTGCCITDGTHKREFSVTSRVFFYPLSDEDIRDYIATGEPMDKAGAYGIQGKGSLLIEKIQGDYFNIVGLPLSALARELKAFLREIKNF